MRRWRNSILIGVCIALGLPASVLAVIGDPSFTSTNYRVQESEIGGNGQFQSDSTHYSINPNIDDGGSSLGENAVGNSSSTSYQTNAGFNTTAQPGLTFIVNTSNVDLGILTTAGKSTGIANFSVKNYTSWGYVVQMIGAAPTYGGHALSALATDTASSAGTEQFGVNTVYNPGSPAVGANPAQVPSTAFSFGVAGDGHSGTLGYGFDRPYTVPNKWRYVSGETIASGPKSSGETDFTMTFLANITTLTPSGRYSGNISLVATGTY